MHLHIELQNTANRGQKMHQSVPSKILLSLVLWRLGPVRMASLPTIRAGDVTPLNHRPEALSRCSHAPMRLTVKAI